MKITMYELLGMIRDGKAPKRIKFENFIYIWRDTQKDYFCERINHSLEDIIGEYLFNNLNLEVEILIEEKKIPEKLCNREVYITQNDCIDEIIKKFNNLLDYLKSKGDE